MNGVTRVLALLLTVALLVVGVAPAPVAADDHNDNSAWWDASWEFRRRLTITNLNTTETLKQGYTVELTLDLTAFDIQGDGDDVRIIIGNAVLTELDRINLDHPAWSTPSTTIWFKLQADIPAAGSDSNYWIYYGNPSAVDPPSQRDNVFSKLVAEPSTLALWHMDEGAGSSAFDQTAFSHDVDLKNGALFAGVDSFFETGDAILLDGQDDRLEGKAVYPTLDHTGPELTLEAWVFMDSFPGPKENAVSTIICKGGVDTGQGYELNIDSTGGTSPTNNAPFFGVGTSPDSRHQPPGPIPLNRWVHLVATWKQDAFMRLYEDGALKGSKSPFSGPITPPTGLPLFLGFRCPDNNFRDGLEGRIDELAIYTRALSAEEIEFHFQHRAHFLLPEPDVAVGTEEPCDDDVCDLDDEFEDDDDSEDDDDFEDDDD